MIDASKKIATKSYAPYNSATDGGKKTMIDALGKWDWPQFSTMVAGVAATVLASP